MSIHNFVFTYDNHDFESRFSFTTIGIISEFINSSLTKKIKLTIFGIFLTDWIIARHPTVDFLFLLPASGKSYLSINLCCAISGVSNAAVVCCHPSDGLGVVANRISSKIIKRSISTVNKYGTIQLCSNTYCSYKTVTNLYQLTV